MTRRPLGISILSVLHVIVGVVPFLFLALAMRRIASLSVERGLSTPIVVSTVLLMALLHLSAGIGYGLGKRWGWWLVPC